MLNIVTEMLLQQVSTIAAMQVQLAIAQSGPGRIGLASVIWSGGTKFSPVSGQLADGLVLRGVLA
jgi:hypothetical protein